MTKAQLNELVQKYCIVPSELDDVIDFVSELLYIRRKELAAKEPYATRAMDDLFKAEHEVYDLVEYIGELEEE